MNNLKWHHQATLTNRHGSRIDATTASVISAVRTANPNAPLTALPSFFQSLTEGLSPIVGPTTDAADSPGTFFTLTGGTTGAPKIIRRTTASWLHSISVLHERLELTPHSNVAALGDLTHSLTLYAAIEALTAGADMHLCRGDALRERNISHLYATPTQLHLMRRDAPLVKHVIVGGGPMSNEVTAHTKLLFPNAQITRFYGAAETSFITLAGETAPPTSVGPAFPGVEIEIRTPENTPCQTGGTGLVWIKSPMLFDSYASGTASNTKWDGDWLTVGELGNLDAYGNLTLKGRIDRVLTIADKSVSLDEIEAELTRQGASAAAVVALPDPKRGYLLHGFTEGNVARHPALKSQQVVPALPRLVSGKTNYRALMALVA